VPPSRPSASSSAGAGAPASALQGGAGGEPGRAWLRFWFNAGLQSSAAVHLTENGKLLLEEGSPDIGGSRASMALIAAETLGVPYANVRRRWSTPRASATTT